MSNLFKQQWALVPNVDGSMVFTIPTKSCKTLLIHICTDGSLYVTGLSGERLSVTEQYDKTIAVVRQLCSNIKRDYKYLNNSSKNTLFNMALFAVLDLIQCCSKFAFDYAYDLLKKNIRSRCTDNILNVVLYILFNLGLNVHINDFKGIVTFEVLDPDNLDDSIADEFNPSIDEKLNNAKVETYYNTATGKLCGSSKDGGVYATYNSIYLACSATSVESGILLELSSVKYDKDYSVSVLEVTDYGTYVLDVEPTVRNYYRLTDILNNMMCGVYNVINRDDLVNYYKFESQRPLTLAIFNLCIQKARFDLNINQRFLNNYKNIK